MNQGKIAKLAEVTSQSADSATDIAQDAIAALANGTAIGIYGGLMMADGTFRHFASSSIMQMAGANRSNAINELIERIL